MSDYEAEQPGSVEPAAPEPVPVQEGFRSPSEATAAYSAEARRLESGEPPPAVVPASHPSEPPAAVEQPIADQRQQFEVWLEAYVEQQAEQQAAEWLEAEIGDLAELGLLDEETLGEAIASLPEEMQAALARRGEQIEEALQLQDIQEVDAEIDRTNELMAAGYAQLHALVERWQAAEPGGPQVDPQAVFQALVETWPSVSVRIGEQPELAVGLARQVWEDLAQEQVGERRAFGMIEQELRKVGVDPDPASVLSIKDLADRLWPEILRQAGGDEQQAVQATIAAATDMATGSRGPQSATSITKYYAAKARAIRAAETGHRDGDPPLRAPERYGPSETTRRYAEQAAAIRARSGL